MKVLLIGPDITGTPGGMSTVIKGLYLNKSFKDEVEFENVVSHKEGSLALRIYCFLQCLFYVIKKQDFQVAHIHSACYGSFYRKGILAFLIKFKRKSVIMHIHGGDFDSFYDNGSLFRRFFIRQVIYNCNRVFVLSRYWKSYFQNSFKASNIEMINNGVDISNFQDCIHSGKTFYSFLYLGRMIQAKGIFDLLKVCDILINYQGKKHLKFYLAGDGEIDKVKQIISDLNLEQNVKLLGWLDEAAKKQVLRVIDSVILPSYNEGLPMALLESMACGKIVLSTNVGGIPDLIEHQVNGFLFQPGDLDEMINKIIFVSENSNLMESISRNNILKIKNHYDLDKINQKIFRIYNSIL